MRHLLVAILLVCVPKLTLLLEDEDEDFEEEFDFADRMEQLKEISAQKGFIRFNKFYFEDYLKWSARNYSFLLLFVDLTNHQRCDVCEQAVDEFAILAKSFRLAHSFSDQLFLGVVDFDESPEIFVQLDVQTLPSVVFVAADQKLSPANQIPRMDVEKFGFSADAVGQWLVTIANLHVRIVRPPNYKAVYMLLGGTLLACPLLLGLWKLRHVAAFWSSILIRLAIMAFCVLMTSGYIFNRLRDTPQFHRSERGLALISPYPSYQYVYETYLICAMQLGFAGCVIVLVDSGLGKNSTGNVTVAAAILFAVLLYSCIVSLVKFKMNNYPYSGLLNVEKYF